MISVRKNVTEAIKPKFAQKRIVGFQYLFVMTIHAAAGGGATAIEIERHQIVLESLGIVDPKRQSIFVPRYDAKFAAFAFVEQPMQAFKKIVMFALVLRLWLARR